MVKNLMPAVAKLLGVELGERFKLQYGGGIVSCLYFFDEENGLMFEYKGELRREKAATLVKIIEGYYKIIKLPFEPSVGQTYYYPDIFTHCPCLSEWEYSTKCLALKALGLVYRTPEEVKAHFAEDYEKLTGKKLEV